MGDKYESKAELASKVEWEGGLAEAIFGYGITFDELPEGTPDEIIKAWRRIEEVKLDAATIAEWLDDED